MPSDSIHSNLDSIRARVFRELNKNPLLTARPLCKILELSFEIHGGYLKKLKNEWKSHRENERDPNYPTSIHGWRGFCYVTHGLSRVEAIASGKWTMTKNANRGLLFKHQLGRITWFETDRIVLWIKKPANLARAYELLGRAFLETRLMMDIKVFEEACRSVRFGAHAVYETDNRLPKMTITTFTEANGITIKLGDRSHPNSVEVIFQYHRQFEDVEALVGKLSGILDRPEVPKRIVQDYSM